MAEFRTAQIVISSRVKPVIQPSVQNVSGRCSVLEILMPQLCFEAQSKVKKQQCLNNVDPYMLEETQQLLDKVAIVCRQLTLYEGEQFKIEAANNSILVSGTFTEESRLQTGINKDKWLKGALLWLHPNYIGLAHSQELVSFSYAYAKNRQQALLQFKHFQQPNQGMQCYVSGKVKHGKLELSWCIESPLVNYQF